MRTGYCVFLVILHFISFPAFTQIGNTRFAHIGIDDGLSQSTVRCMLQDRKGFMWFGTRDGLNKYDGYNFIVYKKDPLKSRWLNSNDIKSIVEDKQEKLWIATWEGGVNVLDPKTEIFTHFKKTEKASQGLSSNNVECLLVDDEDNIWIGTYSDGLDLFDRQKNYFIHFKNRGDDSGSISCNNITAMYQDSDKNIWVGTTNGLNLFNKKNQSFTTFINETDTNNKLLNNKIKFIFEDRRKNLWIGTYGGGLYLFDREKKSFRTMKLSSNGLDNRVLLSMNEDHNGNLWIGTENNGLIVFNPEKNSHTYFLNKDNNPTGISSNTINTIVRDVKGNLWIGTLNGGINQVNVEAGKFNHYKHQEGQNSLSNNIVDAIYEDAKGNLWIGTDGGGIDMFDKEKGVFKNYRHLKNNKHSIAGDYVPAVCQDSKGFIWAGTWGEGMTVFNPQTNQYKQYRYNPSVRGGLSHDFVFYIFKDSQNRIWVGTYGGGLNLYNPKDESFIYYQNEINNPESLSSNYILTINEDKKGRLLIGTDGGGLSILDPVTGRFENYRHNEGKGFLSNNSVGSIWEDKNGYLWLGTNYGLNKLNPITGVITSYFAQDGLANDIVTAILGDKYDNLWIGTARGFSKFNIRTQTFTNFTIADGLQGNEFKAARCLSKNGMMYFGGTNGFNVFDPSTVKTFSYTPPLIFTGFEIFNKEAPINGEILTENINTVKEITISYKESVITFEFAALNFVDKQKKQYAYKLVGFDKEWNYIGVKNSVSYTNLDPGEYTLNIKTLNNDGHWSDKLAKIKLIITPPVWKTWWFRLMLVIGGSSCVLFVFYRRLSAVRQRNRQLENEVFNRTQELKKINSDLLHSSHRVKLQNEKLEEYNREILDKSEEISRQQEHIVYQNQELEKTVKELESSNHTKDRFFSILAHDLKNPVAALSGISDLVRSKITKLNQEQLSNYINDIHKSAHSVYNLLINLLDWAQTQNQTITCNPQRLNVYELIIKANDLLEQQMKRKLIRFSVQIDPSHTIYADEQMIDTVIRNILGNCIKFTAAHGEISIESIDRQDEILIRFKDTGIGMTEERMKNLFEIKKQNLIEGTDGEKGTGLGLVVAKEFIEINNGSINVKSVLGEGSVFTIGLPKAFVNIKALVKTGLGKVPETNLLSDLGELTHLDVKGRTILVVDDSREIRNYLKLLLSDMFSVVEAENGSEGFKVATEVQPDVIISDMLMPVMNGSEFCQKIKNNASTSHIPIVLLTSQNNEDSQLSGYEAGADAYLSKPVHKYILIQVIVNFIRSQENIKMKFSQSEDIYPKDLPFSTLDREFLDKIVNYVEEHLAEPDLDHRKICELTAMSRTVLYAKFKSLTGQGVHDFIKSIRLKKSIKLLQEGRLNINQVSYEVGFNTPSYFSKSFVKQYGMTPTEYVTRLKLTTKI
ncbi:two-component regulator propeller domain-containing protein [Pseudopedobacter beijingensis]|uniref:histidine kinase n=1 Tax=Pseudopedobacter beijingensis TaxID=1207056 RepID=A0ABW4I8U9_9SPHI